MKVYSIYDPGCGDQTQYYPTLAEAKKAARHASGGGYDIEVEENIIATPINRIQACKMLQNDGWCRASRVVFIAKGLS